MQEITVMEDGITRERQFMNDYWTFRKKFYEPKSENTYWMNLITEANELMKKYDTDDYLGGLVLTCIDDLEHRYARIEGRELEHSIVENVYSGIIQKRKEAKH